MQTKDKPKVVRRKEVLQDFLKQHTTEYLGHGKITGHMIWSLCVQKLVFLFYFVSKSQLVACVASLCSA